MSKNVIQIIKAPTGSGKTYNSIQNALFQTFCFQKTSIITTKNKHLVEQIYNTTCEVYKNEKINGQNISQKKITILKHTKDDHLSKNVLLDLFVQGNGIIITVHNYLYAFDDFYNTSFLNALTFVFPQLINVYFDEGDSYINNCYDSFVLFCSYVKQNDTLLQGSNYYSNESWAECKNIDQAIKIIPCYSYKSKSEDGSYVIKTNTMPYVNCSKMIESPKFITGIENALKIKNIFGHDDFDKIPLSLENIENETRTSTRYLLNIDESNKYLYMDKKNKILIYNYLSTIFSNILKQHDPRNYETINSRFAKTFFSDEDIGDNGKSDFNLSPSEFLNQFSFTLKHIYFEKYLFLNEKEKTDFYQHFDKIYNIYAAECKGHKLLFGAKPLESGDEALLHLINTSLKSFIIYYCPYCKFYEIEVNLKGMNNNFDYIKIFKFKERKIETADELYELKKNTDSLKFTSDFIKKKLFKSKKNTLKVDNQDQNINDSETKLSELSENKENLVLSDDEFFASFDYENDLHQIIANKLKSKDYEKIRLELGKFVFHNPSTLVEGNLKVKLIFSLINPEKFPPYGVELELLKDSDFSPRMLGDKRLITSANYDINCLETFKQLNIRFNAFANVNLEHKFTQIVNSSRKVETLYILCGNENYHLKYIKKDFIKFYWNNFTKSFYYIFSKTENIKNKK